MPLLLRLLVCFAIGSIPFAVIAMAGSGIDIRKVGSGNPGFNNVLRVSKGRAVIALIGDMGKGCFAVWLVLRIWPVAHPWPSAVGWAWICGFAAVLGHCFSPLLRFNGGKGVATSGGVMLVLYPPWAVIALAYFVGSRVTMAKLKWPEAGATASLTTWIVFTILMVIFVGEADAGYAALMTMFLFARHRANLRKLIEGDE
ncbi:MAG TPA: glycerol-3-phosphate acyltransferase [Terriglobia bacterium]|nr:glycerol-3-phosphate acyltransferase [Terriglobia bacterium]